MSGLYRRLDETDGIVEELHFDDGEGKAIIHRTADIEPLLDANQDAFNEGLVNKRCEFRRVASFDPVTIMELTRIHGADPFKRGNEKLLERILNDPDLRKFRTLPGYVAVKPGKL